MLDIKIEGALNGQINAELYSSYLYLSMSADCADKGLTGFAKWFKVQAQEEVMHGMRLFNYVVERGGRVELEAIEKPKTSWKTVLDAMKAAYEHETKVTKMINDLVDLAQAGKDHATNSMLQWFVDEQVEEEATADDMVTRLQMIGEAKGALYMLDKEVGARMTVFPDPVPEGD